MLCRIIALVTLFALQAASSNAEPSGHENLMARGALNQMADAVGGQPGAAGPWAALPKLPPGLPQAGVFATAGRFKPPPRAGVNRHPQTEGR
jgi:hypothetical protein